MGGISQKEVDGAALAAMKDPFYSILTYERGSTGQPDPRTLPELTREEFRQWAASLYSRQLSVHRKPVFDPRRGPITEAGRDTNHRFSRWSRRGMRLMAAGLFAIAVEREWPEVAQRWADAYWKNCEGRTNLDDKSVLNKARMMVLQMEFIERAWKLDESRREP